jgi:DnaK suppressor protein
MRIEKVDFFRSLLMNNYRELQDAAGKTSRKMKWDDTRFSDPVDRASTELDQSVELIIRGNECILMREIKDALVRIERGEFGVCQACGENISEKRLLVRPTSRLCIHCKTEEENLIIEPDIYPEDEIKRKSTEMRN